MDGEHFYAFLFEFYNIQNQPIHGNWSFVRWLPKHDGTFNLQFQFLGNKKSIPKNWIVEAKNAQNNGEIINRNWFNNYFNRSNFNDCRASVAVWLIQNF